VILVDEAIWSWRGRKWAHLVSDESYEELHDFAHRIGKRRVGFQGDHYDVHEHERAAAVELGALQVPARDLVRRLRAAGLRHRGGLERWQIHLEGTVADLRGDILDAFGQRELAQPLAEAAGLLASPPASSIVLLEREAEVAIMIEAPGATRAETQLRRLVDEVWIHGPNAGGIVELLRSR